MHQCVSVHQKPSDLKIICILGDVNVGKTTLIKSIHEPGQKQDTGYRPTVSCGFYLTVFIQWWDSSGKEIFMQFVFPIFKLSDCLVLCYDVTNVRSFKKVEQYRRRYIKAAGQGQTPAMVLVGTNLDKTEDVRVTIEMAEQYCNQIGINYHVQVSTLEGLNLEEFLQFTMDSVFRQNHVFLQMKSTVHMFNNQSDLIDNGRIQTLTAVNYEATWYDEFLAKCTIF